MSLTTTNLFMHVPQQDTLEGCLHRHTAHLCLGTLLAPATRAALYVGMYYECGYVDEYDDMDVHVSKSRARFNVALRESSERGKGARPTRSWVAGSKV